MTECSKKIDFTISIYVSPVNLKLETETETWKWSKSETETSEAVVQRCSMKNALKLCKISKNTFFTENLWTTAFETSLGVTYSYMLRVNQLVFVGMFVWLLILWRH